MKRNIWLLFLVATLCFSCSSDSANDLTSGIVDGDSNNDGGESKITENDLVGIWVLTDLRFDEATAPDDLIFAKQILDVLQEQDCDVAKFTFNANNTVVSESKVNYIANNISLDGLELTVNCPEETDIETSAWSLSGDEITFLNETSEDETIAISLEDEETLVIAGEEIDENNYAGAEAVFTRQQ